MRCQICLGQFKNIKFATGRITICKRCVDDLNGYREVGDYAVKVFTDRLRKGIVARLEREMNATDNQQTRLRAMNEYNRLDEVVSAALPQWLNKMSAEKAHSKEHKLLRAQRRGLLHSDRPKHWGYPPSWPEIAKELRKLDKHTCMVCRCEDTKIHVHHILYKSNFGTNRKENLVSLCKRCHENEHGRELDVYEQNESLPHVAVVPKKPTLSLSLVPKEESVIAANQPSDCTTSSIDNHIHHILHESPVSNQHDLGSPAIEKPVQASAALNEVPSAPSFASDENKRNSAPQSLVQRTSTHPTYMKKQEPLVSRIVNFFVRLLR